MKHEAFRSGQFDTKFIEKHYNPADLKPAYEHNEAAALAAGILFSAQEQKTQQEATQSSGNSNWSNNRKTY
jgi:acetyl/propionyl-CoA carboxylase alpha subunit